MSIVLITGSCGLVGSESVNFFSKKLRSGVSKRFISVNPEKSRADLCFLIQIKSVLFSIEEMAEDFLC